MADVARRKLSEFENVEVRTTRFEDAVVESDRFGLVACAAAWHWLEPDRRVRLFAEPLYAHGTAAVIGNVQVTPEEHLPFFVRVKDIYDEFAPEIAHDGGFRKPDDLPPHPLDGSSLFEDLTQVAHPWEWTLDADRYVGLMSTHSPHAALDGTVRERLHAAIARLIDEEFGGSVTENYVAVAALARRVA
jgi:hypothetical protein